MRRRDFLSLVGGATVGWPLAARAQQGEPIRRIGVLMNRTADDPQGQARLNVFQQSMGQLGWSEGRNVKFEVRWGEDDDERERQCAKELVALAPDVILASGTLSVAELQRVTHTVPIVFAAVGDPVGSGLVDTSARPGGNTTGFMLYEYALSAKWLELLKQIAPQLTRAAVLRNPANAAAIGDFSAIQGAAHALGVEVSPINIRDAGEIERAVAEFSRAANSGLIATGSASASVYHNLIIALAARHKLPTIYPYRYMVTGGGLISYGPDPVDQFRQAGGYVDRILKGEKPANLPVQAPTKFELIINLKTAKALGITIPDKLTATADQVIE
jgi:putative ABC transport system substrate-binding protein